MKKKYGEDFYLKRFQEVVCFLTASKIKKHFGTLEKYYAAKNSSKAYSLHIKWNILFHLTRVGSTHKMNELIAASENVFKYHRHCHKTYKDDLNATPPKQDSKDSGKTLQKPKGKHFSRNSWFELSDKVLEDYFAAPEDNFNTKTCHVLSKEAHKFIDWCVFKYKIYKYDTSPRPKKQKKDTIDMTKAEKDKIRQECAEGKHACSADYLIKQREKDERRQAKKQQRMVDKSNEQLQLALKKIEELEKRNA